MKAKLTPSKRAHSDTGLESECHVDRVRLGEGQNRFRAIGGQDGRAQSAEASTMSSVSRWSSSMRISQADRLAAWVQVKREDWEGLVAKDEASRYVGGQTCSWLKVEIRRECRFVVVGLDVLQAGACSLLLAMRQGRRFIYVGRVEWGGTRAVHHSHPEAVHGPNVADL